MFVLPFLDAFNHRPDPTGATTLRFSRAGFELRSARALAPGDEATISYGMHGNEVLLLRFGFCIPGNRDATVPLRGCFERIVMVGWCKTKSVLKAPGSSA